MAPYQKFQIIFNKWFRITSNSIGYNILDKNFKFGIHSGCTVAVIVSILVFCIYTMSAFDTVMQWKGSSVLSLAVQVSVRSIFRSNPNSKL